MDVRCNVSMLTAALPMQGGNLALFNHPCTPLQTSWLLTHLYELDLHLSTSPPDVAQVSSSGALSQNSSRVGSPRSIQTPPPSSLEPHWPPQTSVLHCWTVLSRFDSLYYRCNPLSWNTSCTSCNSWTTLSKIPGWIERGRGPSTDESSAWSL